MIVVLGAAVAVAAPLTGTVRERGTGDPLAGVTVQAGGESVRTEADGGFSLELSSGPTLVHAAHPDYLTVAVPAEVPGRLEVYLTRGPPELEVVVESRRESPHVTRHVLDREQVEKLPGTHDDPMRSLGSLPGVAVTPEYSPRAGDLSLRGASPGESRFFLDGVEIPYLYHFQQYASVIHTRLVDRVTLDPSTFGPQYGDAVGGIIDVTLRAADTDRVHGALNVNSIMAGAYATVPLGKNSAASASGRRSYLDAVESSNDQYTLWPAFWDYLGRVDVGEGWALSWIGAGDRYGRYAGDTAALDPLEAAENASFDFDRQFHGLVARRQIDRGAYELVTTASVIGDRWRGTLPDASQERDELRAFVRHVSVWTPSEVVQVRGGFDGGVSALRRTSATDRAWPTLGVEAPLLARGVVVDERAWRGNGGLWSEAVVRRGALRLQPGLRIQGDAGLSSVALDPRLSAFLQVSDPLRVRAAGGLYSQAPSSDQRSEGFGTPTLGWTRAQQAAAGADLVVAGRLEVGLDAWAKRFQDAVVEPLDGPPRAVDGQAWGLELTSRYRLREVVFLYASGAVGRAQRGGATFGYAQPYALNAVLSWDFAPHWNVGARFRYAAGLPYTPIEGSIYLASSDTYAPVPGETNSARLPDYSKVDLHVERRFTARRWTLILYAEAWVVPPKGNVLYPVWSYDYTEQAYVVGPGLVPLLGARAEL